MPNRRVVENWGFNNLGLECNEYGEVNLDIVKHVANVILLIMK